MSQPVRDSGFTLIEVMVTISLLTAMMATAVPAWSSWATAREQQGAAQELQSVMRQVQQRAVTEGATMCVAFDTGVDSSYTVTRGTCDSTTPVTLEGPIGLDPDVRLGSASFTEPGSPPTTGHQAVEFGSRGTGWPGSVTVVRDGSSPTYTLTVEVLTGHVSITKS
jgi:prepilin-type N-terminal cleavage/methylation domain-containing protein